MASRALLGLAVLALARCLEYSPHALPSAASERDLNARAIERILAQPAAPLRFAVVGDTQRYFEHAKDAVDAINARGDIQFVVQIGDFTHVGLLFEFQQMNEIFERLHVPYLVVVGIHDLYGNGRAIYEEMFGPRDFAFTHARTRFVFYDSNSGYYDDGTVPDVASIEAQLAPGPDHDRALAFAHVAPGSPDFDDGLTAPLLSVLARAGVRLSIHGHAHKFETFERHGVRILIVDSVDHRSYVVVTAGPGAGFDFERVFF